MVSGVCDSLPLLWTIKVPAPHRLSANLTVSQLSCPSLSLDVRDGHLPSDQLLLQVFPSSHMSNLSPEGNVLTSTSNLLRLELHSSEPATNLSNCFADFTLLAHLAEPLPPTSSSLLPLPLVQVLHALSTPLILLAALVGIIVVCTVVMVADFHIKKAKYRKWKALPPSGLSTPTKGCLNLKLAADRQLFPSLSTISDYVPLVQNDPDGRTKQESKSLPGSPLNKHRRRLLRRSETLRERPARRRRSRRALSVGQKGSQRAVASLSSVDKIDGRREVGASDRRRWGRASQVGSCSSRTRRRRAEASTSSMAVTSSEVGSKETIRPTASVSEFSTHSAEMEYDLYDCDLDNAMAAPGSMFAPAYWAETTPTIELELGQLFPEQRTPLSDACESPVELRQKNRRENVLSLTSDLTSSITSAASASTLVGDAMDSSAYYSGEEEAGETTAFLQKIQGGDRRPSHGDPGSSKRLLNLAPSHNLNLTHIESEIHFADSD